MLSTALLIYPLLPLLSTPSPHFFSLPPWLLLDPLLLAWLHEDLGRGDATSVAFSALPARALWRTKAPGVLAGLPAGARVFQLLEPEVNFTALMAEGETCSPGQEIAHLEGTLGTLLMGERVALNLVMRLSGVATLTRAYAEAIGDLPARLVDTRKTTPGLRVLEKYASRVGGALNHRLGLDDAVMIKDNHIAAAGSITAAIAQVRRQMPYPLTLEVETENLSQVAEALDQGADIIMLDNMPLETMTQAVELIRRTTGHPKIEASGNITLSTIRAVAQTGVDYISTSAPITQAPWLDLSMRVLT